MERGKGGGKLLWALQYDSLKTPEIQGGRGTRVSVGKCLLQVCKETFRASK